jgi:hypothetical protein
LRPLSGDWRSVSAWEHWRPFKFRTVVPHTMSSLMYRRCALAMFVAMLLASGCGLLALGPIDGLPDRTSHGGWAERVALCALAGGALWSMRHLHRSGLPPHCRAWTPGAAAIVCIAGLQLWQPQRLTHQALQALQQAIAGAACAWLLMGFLAERVSARVRHPASNFAVVMLGALAVAWQQLYYDWSLQLWLQLTPLWLLPSGLQHLPGRMTVAVEWWALVLLYLAARAAEPLIAEWQPGLGALVSTASLAALYGWLGYRASTWSDNGASVGDGTTGATHRSTSLNTSG